tara:strand:+ start:335 stop:568 length:234 start_codon:yes stop_codon:yes gene_type:complete
VADGPESFAALGYTTTFVLTLGLGIGLDAAIVSVTKGVILAPLAYSGADRIMYVNQPARATGIANSAQPPGLGHLLL